MLNAYNDEMKKLKGGDYYYSNSIFYCLIVCVRVNGTSVFFRFTGPLLKKILDDSEKKIAERSARQLYAYAGHDSTVSNLLSALGVWDQQIPTYNTLALIELHETAGEKFYFKVFDVDVLIFIRHSHVVNHKITIIRLWSQKPVFKRAFDYRCTRVAPEKIKKRFLLDYK